MNAKFKWINNFFSTNYCSKNIKILFKFSYKTFFIICFTFSFIILSVYFTLLFKPLYYMDINTLSIEQSSNINKKELETNYNYVIKYLTQNSLEEFNLPTLPSSIHGKIHFKEVKALFYKLKIMLLFSILISVIGIIINRRHKTIKYLQISSNFLIIIPVLLLIPFLINFDKSFTTFHHIFFNNNYWLFDVQTDPIITILPQTFFFHCAILIIILIALSSILLRYIYKLKYKKLHSL